jgi:hypothetical protein
MDRMQVLFLAANPDGTAPLHLDEEIRAITAKIRAAEYRDALDLVSVWAIRPDDLLQALNQYKPRVVQFSGHGNPAGEIVLLDTNRAPKPVSVTALRSLFATLKDNIQLVVLNACYSEIQATAITEVIDCVVGMSDAVSDEAAITFIASFYRALGFGRSVQAAFDQGKVALLLDGLWEDTTPVLRTKVGVDPAQVFLVPPTTTTPAVGGHGGDTDPPIVLTSKILDVDYVVTVGPDRRRVLVPASGHIVRLTVEATDSRTVILHSLRPSVLSRAEATGRLSPHFGIVTPRPFEVLLDERPPRLRPLDPTGPSFPFKIGPGDPEVFDLRVQTSDGDVQWVLELEWTSGGREGSLRVDLGGAPFRTMARP